MHSKLPIDQILLIDNSVFWKSCLFLIVILFYNTLDEIRFVILCFKPIFCFDFPNFPNFQQDYKLAIRSAVRKDQRENLFLKCSIYVEFLNKFKI